MPVLQISPEAAAQLLEGNTRNRKINKNAIKRYSALMSQGLWKPGNDAICVAPDGTLLNGQHRLTAVIDSGVSVDMLVRHDVITCRGTSCHFMICRGMPRNDDAPCHDGMPRYDDMP